MLDENQKRWKEFFNPIHDWSKIDLGGVDDETIFASYKMIDEELEKLCDIKSFSLPKYTPSDEKVLKEMFDRIVQKLRLECNPPLFINPMEYTASDEYRVTSKHPHALHGQTIHFKPGYDPRNEEGQKDWYEKVVEYPEIGELFYTIKTSYGSIKVVEERFQGNTWEKLCFEGGTSFIYRHDAEKAAEEIRRVLKKYQ